ncbi:TlpA disulfide reductase family protein [Capnocytophaga sp.]|uniref:TlpA family protein disulfide reductase n=1 Tax=Capnocytophaga sp. TaxID=44737 RepID=UPI0026DCCEE0|nr:TlpA disulfide reductase family protein [Capnocytophaga sp.]MDO5106211.1 TlpA disulfide reductase family protein [Capnocytophaga sp.]
MKKISLFLTTICIIGCATPEKKNAMLSGKISQASENKVVMNLPIDGKIFIGNNQEITVNPDGTYQTEIPAGTEGIISLYNHFSPAYLLGGQENYTVDFQGNRAFYDTQSEKIFRLFSELNLFSESRSVVDVKKYPDFESKNKYYAELLESGKKRITEAKKELSLSEKQYQTLNNLFEIRVADLQSTDFFFSFRTFFEQNPEKSTEFAETYLKKWEEIYENAFKNPNFFTYEGTPAFISRYKLLKDIKNTGQLQFGMNTKPYFVTETDFIRANLPAHLVEFAWANAMYEGIMQGKFEKEWITNFDEFKSQFPESKLIPILNPFIEKVVEYNREDNSFAVNFVDDYQNINTLEQLFAKYPGKVLYIDVWATWCVPCRAELQHSKENHHILEEMGVLPVYLSIDNDNADEGWKSMVKKLQLEGVHLRANSQLKEKLDFMKAVPYYLIVGKDGKIKINPAKRPSDKQELFNQLKMYL